MLLVVPDYYDEFQCIQSRCKHNCCIGWEIDIDPDTLERYHTVNGELGERLKTNISTENTPHFRLDNRERCPFLNEHNLCDIITQLGDDYLCDICAMHPRFCNEFLHRTELGLGLCCEAAAKLIVTRKEPAHLLTETKLGQSDPLFAMRESAFSVLQNREYSVVNRVQQLLVLCGAKVPKKDWFAFFLSLERLDETWGKRLRTAQINAADTVRFLTHMQPRQTEYEQLLVYLIYRYFFSAPTPSHSASFAALSYELLVKLGAAHLKKHGIFTVEDQLELIRQFSAEIEYSDENLNRIWNAL